MHRLLLINRKIFLGYSQNIKIVYKYTKIYGLYYKYKKYITRTGFNYVID